MRRLPSLARFALASLLLYAGRVAQGQQACPAPPALTASSAKNIFTPKQEVDLGDVEAEQFERNIRVIHDDDLAAYANGVAARIVAQLPPSDLKIRVILVDVPVVNAFSIAGGRIYVTRKAIAFLRNEDELAGLLGHEMGHALTHQQAIEMTRLFQDILGVTSVSDRKDIFDKFNRVLDNAARNPRTWEQIGKQEEPHQYEADQVALYAMARAGYSPQAFVDGFDRLARTEGKTGNWLSDFLGMTRPNEKRLRELQNNLNSLPLTCRAAEPPASDAFLRWQANVIAYSDLGRDEHVAGLLNQKKLEPPLRTDITQLRFSPDGRYILAQDEASIFIFRHDPLELLMRIDARDGRPAQFTTDSQAIVFSTTGMRVEKWSIAEMRRTDLHEVTVPQGCVQTLLSHDGKTLACVDRDLGISLLDVASGNAVFTKKECFKPDNLQFLFWLLFTLIEDAGETSHDGIVHMAFSPDDHFFVGGLFDRTLAVDMNTHAVTPMHGALPNMVGWGFAFLAPDRVIGADAFKKQSGVVEFPSGRFTLQFPVGSEHMEAPTRGSNTVIVRPLKDAKAGIVDLQTKKILFSLELSPAVDVYDQTFVIERKTGDIALYDLTTFKPEAEAALPRSPLGTLKSWTVSPDLHWLAVSGETRGAVWDLPNSRRLYFTRGFRGGYFDGTNFFSDFPKLEKQERTISRLDLQQTNVVPVSTITEKTLANQYGAYFLVRIPQNKNTSLLRDVTIEIHDVRDNHVLWTRNFPKEVPQITFSSAGDAAVLERPATDSEAQNEIKSDPALKSRFDSMRDRKSVYLLEVLDAATGKLKGRLLIDTGKGSFRINFITVAQDWVLVGDAENRIHIYSLASGVEKGVVFGSTACLSIGAGVLAVENEPGQLDLYSLPNFERRAPLIFRSPISLMSFSGDGRRLFVLTANQNAYTVDPTAASQGAPANAAAP